MVFKVVAFDPILKGGMLWAIADRILYKWFNYFENYRRISIFMGAIAICFSEFVPSDPVYE
jgi:hypothetical protein